MLLEPHGKQRLLSCSSFSSFLPGAGLKSLAGHVANVSRNCSEAQGLLGGSENPLATTQGPAGPSDGSGEMRGAAWWGRVGPSE